MCEALGELGNAGSFLLPEMACLRVLLELWMALEQQGRMLLWPSSHGPLALQRLCVVLVTCLRRSSLQGPGANIDAVTQNSTLALSSFSVQEYNLGIKLLEQSHLKKAGGFMKQPLCQEERWYANSSWMLRFRASVLLLIEINCRYFWRGKVRPLSKDCRALLISYLCFIAWWHLERVRRTEYTDVLVLTWAINAMICGGRLL